MIGTGAMSDPYIPLPENLANIRACLEIIERHGFGLAIQKKSALSFMSNPRWTPSIQRVLRNCI
jgi:DNA repair photolyase